MNSEQDQVPVVFDPAALTAAQRAGVGCVICQKSWPRPEVVVGRVPDRRPVFACAECADVVGSMQMAIAEQPIRRGRDVRRRLLRKTPAAGR